jgi:hypothetical protein
MLNHFHTRIGLHGKYPGGNGKSGAGDKSGYTQNND